MTPDAQNSSRTGCTSSMPASSGADLSYRVKPVWCSSEFILVISGCRRSGCADRLGLVVVVNQREQRTDDNQCHHVQMQKNDADKANQKVDPQRIAFDDLLKQNSDAHRWQNATD